jgi:hypothetical protein
MKAQAGMQMDWDAVRNVNDNGLVQTAKIFDPTEYHLPIPMYYAYKDMWLQEKGPPNLGLILESIVLGSLRLYLEFTKLNRLKPTVGLLMDGVASITLNGS